MQDIKPLLVFATVLEYGSMNAAAAALGMTPSAVSQHINRLEALHGIKLLNRSTRSLAPTDAGRALGEYCRRLAATLADTRTVIDNLKTEPRRRIAHFPDFHRHRVPRFSDGVFKIASRVP